MATVQVPSSPPSKPPSGLNADWWFNTKTGDFFAQDGSHSLEGLSSSTFQFWTDLGIPSTETFAQAQAVARLKFPGSPTTGKNLTSQGVSTPSSGNKSFTPLAGLDAIGSFFNKLGDPNTWIRVSEFIIGALLIISGALQLSGKSGDLKDIAKLTPVGKLL